jgi:peptide/nickel transport system ATP-binding protein
MTVRPEPGPQTAPAPLLRVTELERHFMVRGKPSVFGRRRQVVRAVDGVSFELRTGQTLGLVGESGCGKSTAGRTVLRLLDPSGGRIEFDGEDITRVGGARLRALRREMQIVFQDPTRALNSRQTVGSIIAAPFAIQRIRPPGGVERRVRDLMAQVGLNPEHYNRYPHEFSGGQRQRIGVARAIALAPRLVVCDEPVSSLDVSVQAQVVNLLEDIQADTGMSYLFIAHDLAVVRHIANQVMVMYLGKTMESAPCDELFDQAMHPYTHALLSAVPVPDPALTRGRERLRLHGELPNPTAPPSGCVFRTRCPRAEDRCAVEVPAPREVLPGHRVACHFPKLLESW